MRLAAPLLLLDFLVIGVATGLVLMMVSAIYRRKREGRESGRGGRSR